MRKDSYFLFLLLLSFVIGDDREIKTYRPIIGVLSMDLSDSLTPFFPDKTTYIAASYVKYIESAGGRVVPIMVNRSKEYYDSIFRNINGLVLPGGGVSLLTSQYAIAGHYLIKKAIETNKKDDYFPVWGTCLGFELLMLHTNDMIPNLRTCDAENIGLPLEFNIVSLTMSKIGTAMPFGVYKTLSSKPVTPNFHHKCLTMTNYTYFQMNNFWHLPLSTSLDNDGLEFVSLVEAKNQPIWGSQFHPEKNLFEWKKTFPNKNFHNLEAIKTAQFFANFFVQETRKNNHSFQDEMEEEKSLIYNFKPEFSGKSGIPSSFQQLYLFN